MYMVPNVCWHKKQWIEIQRLTNVLFHDAVNCSRLDRWMKHEYGALTEWNRYGNTEGTPSKSCPIATLYTANPIKPGFGSSLGRPIFSFRLQCTTGLSVVRGGLSWYAYAYYWFYNCNCHGFYSEIRLYFKGLESPVNLLYVPLVLAFKILHFAHRVCLYVLYPRRTD